MPLEARPAPARFEGDFATWLCGHGVPADAALARAVAIHANNALAAATAALAGNYPVLRAALGDAAFAALARRHARAHPPADPRLCLYGRGLPRLVARTAELAAWPWLADLARLEWLVVEALFAAPPPRRPRRLHPDRPWPLAAATRWLASPFPVNSLWQAHQPGARWPRRFPRQGELALVSRPAAGVVVSCLPAAALPLLLALRRRVPLGHLAAAELAHLPALAAAGALVPAIGDG